uniref:Cytochrome c oxidase assembly factor 3 n=1 Tax=Parastrongyloides trichosuri TaxID=131310 RepID=A0A0N4Z9F5_PARTI
MSTSLQNIIRSSLRQRLTFMKNYSLSIKETSKTITIDKARKAELDAKYDKNSEFLQSVEIEDLPRAQQRFAKQFEKINEQRIKEIFKKNYKNITAFTFLVGVVVSIYFYTIYAVKQETFLEEIDMEVAAEKGNPTLEVKKGH